MPLNPRPFSTRGSPSSSKNPKSDRLLAAWRRFGKGRHPAGLNLGDCAAYALALPLNERLPFKGNDFVKTDVAIYPVVSGDTEV